MRWVYRITAVRMQREKDRLARWVPGDLLYFEIQPVGKIMVLQGTITIPANIPNNPIHN